MASDAELQKIDQEMDEAFVKNVAKHQKIQADKKTARQSKASAPVSRRQLAEQAVAIERQGLSQTAALTRVLKRHHLTRWPGPQTPTGQTSSPPRTSTVTPPRVASDADHQRIDREMDEAFVRNVARNRKIQDEKKAARTKA